ncbi:Protein of unknown function DUF2062 [Desulfotomaculum nigrificans CO-1-SRB]|uniref:DUF2062 domain-containing protein n=1 Tax=Desulfotomaculum nigrificans (strain DSM 14880 / VKM B-2319 / CO-1-SRB) TaxID=868595 RepID=F6B648_DESCC|nr:DUF2062 domain-containing protein [Desulfotomaculum nigrificans]AEF95471.1 Protein of unknown function DUF2062 [Desulfotomaculum nigrificans CO-1-SRB]
MANIIKGMFFKVKDAYHRLLNLPEAPQKVAQGIALGMAFDFLPVPFISIPLSFIVAKLIRVHAVAATLTVILFKWAVPLFFTLNIFVGKALVGSAPSPIPPELGEGIPVIKRALLEMKALGLPFLVGSVINALWASLVVYFVALKILKARQRAIKKNPEQQQLKQVRLKQTKLDCK